MGSQSTHTFAQRLCCVWVWGRICTRLTFEPVTEQNKSWSPKWVGLIQSLGGLNRINRPDSNPCCLAMRAQVSPGLLLGLGLQLSALVLLALELGSIIGSPGPPAHCWQILGLFRPHKHVTQSYIIKLLLYICIFSGFCFSGHTWLMQWGF